MRVLHTGKVPRPKVDVWDVDYGVTYTTDPEEDATTESQAILHESPAAKAVLPKSDEQPIVNADPSNLQPHKKHAKQSSPRRHRQSAEEDKIDSLDAEADNGKKSKTDQKLADIKKETAKKVILENNENKAEESIADVEKAISNANNELLKAVKEVSMQPGKCFYINSLGDNGSADTGLVLEVSSEDKYAPKKTGVYDIGLKKKAKGNKAQMWSWDDAKGTLSPFVYPNKALFEGSNKNMIVFANRGMKQQQFEYDQIN